MTSDPVAYLDHAATTPMRPEAIAAWTEVATGPCGNPSGAHSAARAARRTLDDARDVVADALGARPGEVVFTGGGTEADNLAVLGRCRARGGVAVGSAVEHHAVLHSVEAVDGRAVGVDARGRLDLDELAAALGNDVAVVSIMAVNNESGIIADLGPVAEVVARHAPGAVLHTDAVQAVAWVDTAVACAPAGLIAISAHKFGGPQGVGALVVREGVDLAPLLLGGGQERERRSGTQAVAGVAAMAAALDATVRCRAATVSRVGALRDRLVDGLITAVPGVTESGVDGGDRSHKVASIAHLLFEGIESEALLFLLDRAGVQASAASSCASGAQDPSHVLAAMGVDRERAAGSLRLSLGHPSTDADIDRVLAVIPPAVAQLRANR